MKKTLFVDIFVGFSIGFLILGILSLAGCGEPIPKDQWLAGKDDLKSVAGFEDCFIAQIKRNTNSNPIIVIRCPSSTVSSTYRVPNGKSSYDQSTIVASDAPTVVDHRVAQLEQQVREQDELIRKQQESLRTSLAIIKKEGN
jgi:hypothetical protein